MNGQPIRIVYFGTAEFAVPPLRALLADEGRFKVVAVVTQPDRPGHRGKVTRSPVALVADEAGVPTFQPETLKEDVVATTLQGFDADLFLVAAYGLLIPRRILDIPRLGALNFHGSLLPALRGASPIQTAIRQGLAQTGVTLMKMDAKMDHGPMLATVVIPISPEDDHRSLEKKLGESAAAVLVPKIIDYASGTLEPEEQDHDAATFAPLMTREDFRIPWALDDAVSIERMTRAFRPRIHAFTEWRRKGGVMRLQIIEARPIGDIRDLPPGRVAEHDGLPVVGTKNGALAMLRVRPEGKNDMDGPAFLRGYPDVVGSTFLTGNDAA